MRWGAVLLAVLTVAEAFAHPSKALHRADCEAVYNGYRDPQLRAFYEEFSSGIDSKLLEDIKQTLGEKFGCDKLHVSAGDHRLYGHSWPFADAIPRVRLTRLEKIHPGAWEALKPVWAKFCGEKIKTAQQELKLPRKQAAAFCATIYYIHILGDWDPKDNSRFQYVMSVEEIIHHLNKQYAVLFVNHPEIVKEITERLKAVQGTSDQGKALKVMAALKELKLGTKLHETWGKYFEAKHPWSGE